jgi:integrase
MPALQRGSTYPTPSGRGIRWYENGKRKKKTGFRNDSEAFAWWDTEIAPRLRAGVRTHDVTFREHAERYLRVHLCSEARRRALRSQLGLNENERERDYETPIAVFGSRLLRDLERAAGEMAEWAATLPPSGRRMKVGAVKQVLAAALDWNLIVRNPAASIAAPVVRAQEVEAFANTEEVDLVAFELGPPWAQLIVLATETGLRPEEFVALERRDVDRKAGALTVQRCYTVDGGLKQYGKTSRSLRTVALSDRALAAIEELPAQLRTPLLFPTYSGGYRSGAGIGDPSHMNLRNWRKRTWRPALRAAGLERNGRLWLPVPYVMRHTFATWMLEAGCDLWRLARVMGSSVQMVDKHYGHLTRGHVAEMRGLLNRRPSIVTVDAPELGAGD